MKLIQLQKELPRSTLKLRQLKSITTIIVHHSADSPQGLSTSAKEIARIKSYHRFHKKWFGISYHFVIAPSGRTYKTANIGVRTAHANPVGNKSGIGICLIGNFEIMHPTINQLTSLQDLVQDLKTNMPTITMIKRHKDIPGNHTACCGKNLPKNILEIIWKGQYHGQE